MTAISIPLTSITSTSTSSSPSVASSTDSGLAQDAVALSSDSAIVSLFGASAAAGVTYDAAGLFNAVAQAGSLDASSATTSVDQQLIASLAPTNAGVSGLDALAATVQAGSFDQNASYAAILKQIPSAASTVIADSTEQGIISTISTWA